MLLLGDTAVVVQVKVLKYILSQSLSVILRNYDILIAKGTEKLLGIEIR
jgi:hypothetical protein